MKSWIVKVIVDDKMEIDWITEAETAHDAELKGSIEVSQNLGDTFNVKVISVRLNEYQKGCNLM